MNILIRCAASLAAAISGAPWALAASGSAPEATSELSADPPCGVLAVARIQGKRGGDKHIGSGFLYPDNRHVITAAHVAVGCDAMQVAFELSGQRIQSVGVKRVEKILFKGDLALLELDAPIEGVAVMTLRDDGTRPGAADTLAAYGFPSDSPDVRGIPLTLEQASPYGALERAIPPAVSQRIRAAGVPFTNVDVEVIDFASGYLRPGSSGGPILDAKCRVVGIANGGVDNESTSVCWGIPVDAVKRLMESKDVNIQWKPEYGKLFNYSLATQSTPAQVAIPTPPPGQVVVTQAPVVREAPRFVAAGLTFERVAVRRLGDMNWSSAGDDPFGLDRLIGGVRQLTPWLNPNEFSFDIYQEAGSGATVLIPSGWQVQPTAIGQATALECTGPRPEMKLIITLSNNTPPANPGQASGFWTTVLLNFMSGQGIQWQPDPVMSYGIDPNTGICNTWFRPDGVAFTRKSYGRYTYNMNYNFWMPTGYMFETHTIRGPMLLTASAISFVAPVSQTDPAYFREWFTALLAVHMTVFAQ